MGSSESDRVQGRSAGRVWRVLTVVLLVALANGLLFCLFALRQAHEEYRRSEALRKLLMDAVHETVPDRRKGSTSLLALYDYLEQNMTPVLLPYPRELAELRMEVGDGLSQMDQPQRALAMARQSVISLRQLPDSTDLTLADAYASLARIEHSAGAEDEAEADANTSVGYYERVILTAPEHRIEVIRMRTLLGNLRNARGDWLGAMQSHAQLLEDRRTLIGDGKSGLAVDYYNLANAQMLSGQLDPAIGNYRESIRLMQGGDDDHSLHMAFAQHSLYSALTEAGRYGEAEQLYDQVDALYAAGLPADSPHRARLVASHAEWLRASGKPQQALEEYDRVGGKPEGDVRMSTRARIFRMQMLIDLGRYRDAEDWLSGLVAKAGPRDRPLEPFLQGAKAYLAFRNGELDAPVAMDGLDLALKSMRDSGYGALSQAKRLQSWRDELTASGG